MLMSCGHAGRWLRQRNRKLGGLSQRGAVPGAEEEAGYYANLHRFPLRGSDRIASET